MVKSIIEASEQKPNGTFQEVRDRVLENLTRDIGTQAKVLEEVVADLRRNPSDRKLQEETLDVLRLMIEHLLEDQDKLPHLFEGPENHMAWEYFGPFRLEEDDEKALCS